MKKVQIFALIVLPHWLFLTMATAQGTNTTALTKESAIERVYIDRSSSHDPGTIVAVLKNNTNQAIKIGEISVNGTLVKDWPTAADPVLWHRITHPVLEPGQGGLILLKLAQYGSDIVRMTVKIEDTLRSILLSTSISETVRIEAIRYDPSGTGLNVFITNNGKTVEKLRSIELNDKKVWVAQNQDISIVPGMTEVAHISLGQTLKAGQTVLLKVNLENRILGVRSRAIPGFRISIESGDQEMAKRIAADPLVLDSFQFREEQTAEKQSKAAPSLVERQGSHWSIVHVSHGTQVSQEHSDLACVFACPTHATDSYYTSAYLAMMAQEEVEKQPCWQSFIHACRSQPLRGLAMFGQIADCVRFNAQLKTELFSQNENRDEVPWAVYQMVHYAVVSAAPSLALPMIPVEKDPAFFSRQAPLPMQERQMVYSALSAGAGGLCYRIMEQDWGKESRDAMFNEITQVNQEVRQIRDYLAMGFPRPIAVCKDPKIQVACIDAMPRGMVLIVINNDLQKSAPEMPPSIEAKEHHDVAIEVSMPEGIKHVKVNEIYGTQCNEFKGSQYNGSQLSILFPSLTATKMLLIQPEGAKARESTVNTEKP